MSDKLRRLSDANLTKVYVEARDRKRQIEADAKNKIAPIAALMDDIEAELLRRMTEQGVQSMKTAYGSPYRAVRHYSSIVDEEAFRKYVLKTGRLDLLQSRPVTSELVTLRDEGTPVPGTQITGIETVSIRRS